METSKRCQCKRIVCESCHVKDWKKHKGECQRPNGFPVFTLPEHAKEFCDHVKRCGFGLLKARGTTKLTNSAVPLMRDFFAQDFEMKRASGAGPGPGQAHGYMDLTWTEVFEVRSRFDRRFNWPSPALEHSLTALHSNLRGIAVAALETLCREAGVASPTSLLDEEPEVCLSIAFFFLVVLFFFTCQQKDDVNLSESSNSALRVLLYSKPSNTGRN